MANLATHSPTGSSEKMAANEKAHVSDMESGRRASLTDYEEDLPDPDVGKSEEERARLV